MLIRDNSNKLRKHIYNFNGKNDEIMYLDNCYIEEYGVDNVSSFVNRLMEFVLAESRRYGHKDVYLTFDEVAYLIQKAKRNYDVYNGWC